MAGIEIDIDGLDTAGRRLDGTAARFVDALSAFQAQLGGFGQPWGGDDIGALIGAAHDEVSAWAFECYQAALDEIAAAGVDLSGMAASYTATEQSIAEQFASLQLPGEGA